MSAWLQQAACRDHHPDDFIVDGLYLNALNVDALRTCTDCPVRSACDAEYRATAPNRRINVIAGGTAYNEYGHERPLVSQFVDRMHCADLSCGRALSTMRLARGARYCSTGCKRRNEERRARARRRAGVR